MASITTLGVTCLIKAYPELEWAIWRLPFILALLGSSIGLYIRLCIPESLEYVMYYANHPKPTCGSLFKQGYQYMFKNKLKCLYVIVLSCLGVTTTFQIYIYGPTQTHLYGHFTDTQIILSNMISLILMLCIFPIMGKLSDRMSREKIVIAASLGFWFLSLPYFYLISQSNYPALILIQSLISIPAGAYYATVPVLITEIFPLNLRCTVLSVLYSTAAGLSAGLTPILSVMLLTKTGSSVGPTLLIIGLVFFSWVLMAMRRARDISVTSMEMITNRPLL